MQLNDSKLIRFWFTTESGPGVGVTAYSRDDAAELIREAKIFSESDIISVAEDVDIRTLDQNHVIPNMGPPNFRGIWFPNLFR